MRWLSASLNTLGLLLQLNGVANFLPIAVAFYSARSEDIAAFSFMALLSLSIGFILRSIFKSEEHNYLSLSLFTLLTFVTLGVLGSIPYLMLSETIYGDLPPGELIVNSIFESVSGYTTAGLTTIAALDHLSPSLIYYRGLTQWLGGLNILFIVMLLFMVGGMHSRLVPEVLGFERVKASYKENLIQLVKTYLGLTLVFIAALIAVGVEPFYAINIVFTGISTGGFTPVDDLRSVLNFPALIITLAMMVMGALNFTVHEWTFGRSGRRFYKIEIVSWSAVLVIVFAIFSLTRGLATPFEDLFHVMSAATTTGFQLSDLRSLEEPHKFLLLVLFFLGGNSFSTAGGLKTIRLLLLLKTMSWFLKRSTSPPHATVPLALGKRDVRLEDLTQTLTILIASIFLIIISSTLLMFSGIGMIDSLFEATSAWATTGLTSGVTLTCEIVPKIVLIVNMILGRIELIPFIALSAYAFRRAAGAKV